MKIKTKKKMNLPELIQYIMDNEELRGLFYSPTPLRGGVKISNSGEILVENVWADDTFTVEVEEELTEETEFEELWESYWDSEDLIMMTRSMSARNRIGDDVVSINGIKSTNGDIIKTVAIFYKDTLIWSAKSGIPESGVLEVSE